MSVSDSDSNIVLIQAGDVQDFNSENILPLPVEDLAQLTKWLQPTPYDCERSEYSRHRASHLLGTGTWLTVFIGGLPLSFHRTKFRLLITL